MEFRGQRFTLEIRYGIIRGVDIWSEAVVPFDVSFPLLELQLGFLSITHKEGDVRVWQVLLDGLSQKPTPEEHSNPQNKCLRRWSSVLRNSVTFKHSLIEPTVSLNGSSGFYQGLFSFSLGNVPGFVCFWSWCPRNAARRRRAKMIEKLQTILWIGRSLILFVRP